MRCTIFIKQGNQWSELVTGKGPNHENQRSARKICKTTRRSVRVINTDGQTTTYTYENSPSGSR